MTPAGFKSWRKAVGLSQEKAAEALGIGRRTLQDYEAGAYPIPLHIALACAAIFHRLEPWAF